MKKRILKLLLVTGVYVIVLCSATGLAAVAAPAAPADPPAVQTVSAAPAAQTDAGSAGQWTGWISAAVFFTVPSAAATAPGMSFEELVDEVTAPAHVYSEQEKEYIARVVYAEARGEAFEGKVAVAAVVLNRFESGKFGSTVKRVVLARHQFAVSRRYNDECMVAVTAAIDQRSAFPDDMYYFQASKSKHWRHFEYYARIGRHSFYCA